MSRSARDMNIDSCAHAYNYLGAHLRGDKRVFRVWAPNARSVSLVGDFCSWDNGIAMERTDTDGVWQIALDASTVKKGDKYKYKIILDGGSLYKSDPYAFACECEPAAASVISDIESYGWRDGAWMSFRERKAKSMDSVALSIYGVELDVWERARHGGRLGHSELACYAKQMGYTHVLLTDAQENRSSGCCHGVCSLLSPNSNYGSPEDIAAFVDALHEAGVGVIFEISFDVFPNNEGSLLGFDGTALYERADVCSPTANIGRKEVRDLVLSTAIFWIEKYHADGLYLKGLSSLICPSDTEERYAQELEFVRQMLKQIKSSCSGVALIAECDDLSCEDASALGFDALCDKGRADHTLFDTGKDPFCKNVLSFVTYDASDTLNLSQLRAFIGYKTLRSNKRLTPMGAEFGRPFAQGAERVLEWELLEQLPHARLQKYVAELNQLCLSRRALSGGEVERLICNGTACLIHSGGECVSLINLTPTPQTMSLSEHLDGIYRLIFCSDDAAYGGIDTCESCGQIIRDGRFDVPAFSLTIFERAKIE